MTRLRMQKGDELISLMSSVRPARAPGRRWLGWEERRTDKIGVFICRCGGAVEGKVDVDSLSDRAASLPGVTIVDILDFSCSSAGRERIKQRIRESDLDRFVVAGCSPKVVEDLFSRTAMEASLNPFMFEIANLKEQCAMVHGREAASRKARALLQAAVAKCALLYPPPFSFKETRSRTVLVVGNGLSAMLAAIGVAEQGGKAIVALTCDLEHMRAHGLVARNALDSAISKAIGSPGVKVLQEARVEGFHGGPGDFRALLATPDVHESLECGAAILAMEVEEATGDRGIMSLAELEGMLARGEPIPRSVMFVSLDSSRDKPWQVRAIETALGIKERQESEVTIVVRDVLTFGLQEVQYRRAQSRGVRFVYTDRLPELEEGRARVMDLNLGTEILLPADLTVMSRLDLPLGTREMSRIFETPIDEWGFFRTTQVRLKPVASIREGLFLCGSAVGPRTFSETVSEASAAASMAMELVSIPYTEVGGAVAEVEAEKCSACLACLRSCPFGAPFIGEAGKAEIDMERCQGCGICVSICPSKAIQMHCYTDAQLDAQSQALCREGVE